MRASIDELWGEYMFPLANLCNVDITKPLKLRDFFRLILNVDAYVAAQENA